MLEDANAATDERDERIAVLYEEIERDLMVWVSEHGASCYTGDSMYLEIQHRNNLLATSCCSQQMLLFQTLNHALYAGFEFAMYGPRELFLLVIAYAIGRFSE